MQPLLLRPELLVLLLLLHDWERVCQVYVLRQPWAMHSKYDGGESVPRMGQQLQCMERILILQLLLQDILQRAELQLLPSDEHVPAAVAGIVVLDALLKLELRQHWLRVNWVLRPLLTCVICSVLAHRILVPAVCRVRPIRTLELQLKYIHGLLLVAALALLLLRRFWTVPPCVIGRDDGVQLPELGQPLQWL